VVVSMSGRPAAARRRRGRIASRGGTSRRAAAAEMDQQGQQRPQRLRPRRPPPSHHSIAVLDGAVHYNLQKIEKRKKIVGMRTGGSRSFPSGDASLSLLFLPLSGEPRTPPHKHTTPTALLQYTERLSPVTPPVSFSPSVLLTHFHGFRNSARMVDSPNGACEWKVTRSHNAHPRTPV
jgi:hypothetical protein